MTKSICSIMPLNWLPGIFLFIIINCFYLPSYFKLNFNQNTANFFQESVFEIADCKICTIYSGLKCVKVSMSKHLSQGTSIRLWQSYNTLRPRQNGRRFPDAIFKCVFLNENLWISIKITLKFVHKSPINNIPALIQIMAWHQSGDNPLSEAMMLCLLTHMCVTRPQWVEVTDQTDHSMLPGLTKCQCETVDKGRVWFSYNEVGALTTFGYDSYWSKLFFNSLS